MIEFVDTNVLVYGYDTTAGAKRGACLDLLTRLHEDGAGAISIQVLSEFYSVTSSKLKVPGAELELLLNDFSGWVIHRPSLSDIVEAGRLRSRYKLPWWDALILQSALSLGCTTLWTEDFSDGQRFGTLTVRSPFS